MFLDIGKSIPSYPAIEATACEVSNISPNLGGVNKMSLRTDKNLTKLVRLGSLINKLNIYNNSKDALTLHVYSDALTTSFTCG